MSKNDQLLLTRALNASRHSFFPTYAGLRLIGEQVPNDSAGFLDAMVRRRIQSGDKWRFREFQMYKGSKNLDAKIEHEYRTCIAPSPITALAEAYILGLLAQSSCFSTNSNTYSYRWPKNKKSGSSYEFFASGYKQRNLDIEERLKVPGSVAVITDIKSFYPSAKKNVLINDIKHLITKSSGELKDLGEGIIDFYSQLVSCGPPGIPIGPSSAHILGNLCLSDVDTELSTEFGHSYFRYVDDIIVICDAAETQKTKNKILQCLSSANFEINEDKTIELNYENWKRCVSRPDIAGEDSFHDFSSDLAIYLAFHPKKSEALKTAFKNAGVSIPINRLLALSSYSRYRYFISRRSELSRNIAIWMTSEKSLIERSVRLKNNQLKSLDALISEPSEDTPSLRRWQVQRIRRVVNSLFYLQSFGEWEGNTRLFDSVPELIEQQALAKALSSGCIDSVLPFFGRGPSAFAELWHEHGDRAPTMSSTCHSVPATDSLTVLRLHGVLPENIDTGLSCEHRLFTAAAPSSPNKRKDPDLSFEDEFESLRLGSSGEDISKLTKTRYSRQENSSLEALLLLSSEYRS